MATNPLDDWPRIRRAMYIAQWMLNGVMGALTIIFLAVGDGLSLPLWFMITGAVLNFVWTYTGITAQSNTPQE